MRKRIFFLLLVLALLLCGTALAQDFTFRDIYATCTLDDAAYIILTPDNLADHTQWLDSHGLTQEAFAAELKSRGVLAQAWTPEGDVCVEITAVQDEQATTYYDLDQQDSKARTAYANGHTKGTYAQYAAWDFKSAAWKKADQYGRFLSMRYSYASGSDSWSGYMRRTIRNGYTVTVDLQVHGRKLKSKDNTTLSNIMKTFAFTEIKSKPAEAVVPVTFTTNPPEQTNSGKFTLEGTGGPGLQLVVVLLRMTSTDATRLETTVDSKGKFSLDVELPQEGYYNVAVTVLNGETVVQDIVFDNSVTYNATLLPVNYDSEIPATLTSDELVISGKTIKNVTVQCLVGDTYSKQVKTNNSGAFRFKVDTSEAGDYTITMVFSKKGYQEQRTVSTATRSITAADQQAQWRAEAVKPAYSTLTSKLKGYTDRVMVYTLYYVKGEQLGGQWVMQMAMDKKGDAYRNYVIVTMDTDPGFIVGDQVRMYGRCTGAYSYDSGDGAKNYPGFALLFWDE